MGVHKSNNWEVRDSVGARRSGAGKDARSVGDVEFATNPSTNYFIAQIHL